MGEVTAEAGAFLGGSGSTSDRHAAVVALSL